MVIDYPLIHNLTYHRSVKC